MRKLVTGRVEFMRREKQIGSSLEAYIGIASDQEADLALLQSVDFAEICIVGQVEYSTVLKPGMEAAAFGRIGMIAGRISHHKCTRCWRHLPDVAADGALCSRCDHVVSAMDAAV